MIGVEDWAEIRRLHRAEGMSIKGIAQHLGIARNTVRRAVASDDPPRYRRVPKGSIVDAVEPAIRELPAEYPRMPPSTPMPGCGTASWPTGAGSGTRQWSGCTPG
ncbi:Helix-turn-helix domain-containing protein, partial [Streptomyces sp. Ncost-T10-10d]